MASTENMETENIEDKLVTYIKNILKHQIIPIDVTNLRTLIKEAPKKLKLFDYVQDKYPDSQFLEFLMKYPDSFNLNPDGTVTIAGPNYCTFSYSNSTTNSEEICDEVDGSNREEYVSDDSDSDEESVPDEKEILLNPGKEVTLELEKEFNALNVEKSRQLDSESSSCSESSDDYFSSELVQTSDSLHSSSMSSDSSSEN